MAQLLIERGADVHVFEQGVYKWTPLIIAVWNDYEEIVKMLIKKGVDVNIHE